MANSLVNVGQFTWQQIATGQDVTGNNYYGFVANGDAVLFCSQPNAIGKSGFGVQIFGSDGSWTWWRTPYLGQDVYGAVYSIRNIVNLGNNNFLVTVGTPNVTLGNYYLTLRNVKANNTVPFRLLPNAAFFSNPCFGIASKYFYDAARKILGIGYYNGSGGSGGQVYTSCYRMDTSPPTLIAQGLVGNYSDPGADAFDQTTYSNPVPNYVSGPLIQSNGMQSSIYYDAHGVYYLVANQPAVNTGIGIVAGCNTPCGAYVYNAAINYFPLYNDAYQETTNVDCDVAGLLCYENPATQQVILCDINGNGSYATSTNYGGKFVGGFTQKPGQSGLLYGINSNQPNGPPTVNLGTPVFIKPTSVRVSRHGVINNVVPISLTGAYAA